MDYKTVGGGDGTLRFTPNEANPTAVSRRRSRLNENVPKRRKFQWVVKSGKVSYVRKKSESPQRSPSEEGENLSQTFILPVSAVQILLFSMFEMLQLSLCLGYDPHRRHELWRFFTLCFVHLDWSHLLESVGLQLIFGLQLEHTLSWRHVGVIYFAGVCGGSLLHSYYIPKSPSVGSSCGVYSLVLANFLVLFTDWKVSHKRAKITRILTLCCLIIGQLWFYSKTVGENGDDALAMILETLPLHLGGGVVGLLVAFVVLLPDYKTLRRICQLLLFLGLGFIITYNIYWSGNPQVYLETEWNLHYRYTYQQDRHAETEMLRASAERFLLKFAEETGEDIDSVRRIAYEYAISGTH